ncbi:MAG TPA: dihydrofolate reductase family protein [Chryseosolibacter sp.]
MRKIKLQMNLSLGDKWDDGMTEFCIDNLRNVDAILLGRTTAEGFIPYWADIAKNPSDSFHALAQPLHTIPKIVFSNTLKENKWDNATVVAGDFSEGIKALKNEKGKDIMVYGGNAFAASLIEHDFVDECHLMINPAALGNGKAEFNPLHNNFRLKLAACKPFDCGVVLLSYSRT